MKIKSIDSLISVINSSNLIEYTDTIINNMPELGLYAKTFASVSVKDSELIRYSNKVFSINRSGQQPDTINTLTIFYFYERKLIKVEDSGTSKGKGLKADWYYFNEQSLYYSLKSERSEDRANLLLVMGKAMQDQFHKRVFGKKE